MNCKICGKPLNESQYAEDKRYKSCPRCSAINGKEHVFLEYPESFGTTDKRKTLSNPDGPQSYCRIHRSNFDGVIPEGGILCSELNN